VPQRTRRLQNVINLNAKVGHLLLIAKSSPVAYVSQTRAQQRFTIAEVQGQQPGVRGSSYPQDIYLGVKHTILTPFLKRNTFWYTGQSIICKIIKNVATSRQILRLKCTKFGFGCGSAPDPAGGAYSAPHRPHS